jgi:cell division protein FtsB
MSEEKKPKKKIDFFASKWFLAIGFLILVLVALALGRETYRKYQVQKKIDDLRAELGRLEKSNQDLSDMIAFLQTDEYRERQARQKLNLKADEEEVVVVPEIEIENEIKDENKERKLSNPEKWWNYFFEIKE